jgi:putative DNA primase/helicase
MPTWTARQQGRNAMHRPETNLDDDETDSDRPWRDPLGHVVRLGQVEAEPVQWLSPGRLAAGKITVLDGDPGLGKSTLLCEFAARITRGQALPGGKPADPRDVIILSAEDDLYDTIRPRIDGAGGDPGRIVSFLAVPDGSPFGRPFVIPGHLLLLEAIVIRTNATLVIIDPLMAYMQPGHSANSDQAVRRALASLKAVGDRTGVAIVVVRHLNKSSSTNPLYRGGGSIGILGAARCGLLLAQDPEHPQRRILAATKGNLGRPPASLAFHLEPVPRLGVTRVVWEGETPWTAEALLRATAEGDEERSALGDARAWLRQVLADGPRPARELVAEARTMGIAVRTYHAARKAEGVIARKEQTLHGGWIVTLPESPQPDQ